MRFSLQTLALAVTLLLVSLHSVFAQNYPTPGKQGQAPVICTGCSSRNVSGQDNDGLKTWPYGPPLINHTGRFVNADQTRGYQGPGIRTLHARRIRVAREQRGAAPPRAYIQLGSAIGVYSLNTFFSATLPAGPVSAADLVNGTRRAGNDVEKVARWDALVHPEGKQSGWVTPVVDGQDRLFDFAFDDRGYVYVAAGLFGWGIVKDNGETGGTQLSLVDQTLIDGAIGDPRMIVAFKSGSKYYAVISDDVGTSGRHVWDVTNPANPVSGFTRLGTEYAMISWAKDDTRGRIAIVTGVKTIEIYDNEDFATGGGPIETFAAGGTKGFKDVTVDENGNFWTSEATKALENNKLVKLERTASGYTKRPFDVYGGPFTPGIIATETNNTIEYGDKYLAVVGRGEGSRLDARLFKIEGGEPVPVDLNKFFRNYYWASPPDYAQPGAHSGLTFGLYPVKWNNKIYLIQSTNGLGDVFELQAGDSITGSQKSGIFGTNNPHSKPTESGPFYADLMKFRAESSNPSFPYNVVWNFDNTESLADNEVLGFRTGQDVEHRFTGLNTVAKITQIRQVKVHAPVNPDMNDTVSVTLKVPTARIGIGGTNIVVTADSSSLEIVAGDVLTDASDGTVESHYAAWTIDGVPTKQEPDQTMPAGDVGPHTVTLAANYGKYDASFDTVGSPYVDTVSNVSYVVRPFIVELSSPTTAGDSVTFKGTARKTSLTTVLLATTWTVDWSLKAPGGADVVPPLSSTVPVGQIPNFPVADKGAIPSGSLLKLKVSVDLAGVIPAAANYISHEVTQELITPDPQIAKSGCANANDPCTFTASSILGNPITGWTMTWTLKKSGVQVGSPFTGNPFKPTITEAGSYSVSLTATTTVFSGTATIPSFTVAAPLCTNPPTLTQMSIFTSCHSGCDTGDDIIIRADPFHYSLEDCEEYLWNFGDGGTATTTTRQTTHKYSSNGTKTIRLKVRKGTALSPEFTETIQVGGNDEPPPPPPCTAPTNIDFTYSGPNGCGEGTPCKAGQSLKFIGLRGTSSLATCDVTTWTFHDGSTTTKSPSKTYPTAGSYTVRLVVSNTSGTSQPVTKTITIAQDTTPSECEPPNAARLSVTFRGRQSNCTATSSQPCTRGEIIDFKSELFPLNNPQSCDKFEWNFGDGTPLAATQTAQHTYSANGTAASYPVAFRWYNNQGTVPVNLTVRFNQTPVIPPPVLLFTFFPTTGSKGDTVTFAAQSNMDTTTGWTWTFGDGTPADTSQATAISRTSSVTHTFANAGPFTVKVSARNSTDTSSVPPQGSVQNVITLADVVHFKYLLPAIAHSGPWKSDVQIYTSDAVSAQSPLIMTATYLGTDFTLSVPKSTHIYEDFLKASLDREGAGPVVITTQNAKVPPQIWTRTYNQTDNGTFGQFIPAIRIDSAGGGASFGEGDYYLAGLRFDNRYRTNIGLVNPNPTAINATVRTYDDEGLPLGTFTRPLGSFQLDQFNIGMLPDAKINQERPFSVEIEVPPGQWLYAYASFIDGDDPAFLQAVRESELTSDDYRTIMVPAVGHFNTWRSDVTVFNPPGRSIPVDLAYFDQGGKLVSEAKSVLIGGGEFLQYDDLLKEGVLGSLGDSFGLLRITVPASISATHLPFAFARTYSDDGSGKTYGQGIGGFAAARANVKSTKPALIPGIRNDSKYRTDIGITNVTDQAAVATVRYLDPNTGVEFRSQQFALTAYESVKATDVDLGGRAYASVKIEVIGSNVWAYGSIIDRFTLDPEYVQAMPLP